MTDQLRTVVTAQADRPTVHLEQLIQNADHITGGDAASKPNIDALAGEVIDHRQAMPPNSISIMR